MRKKKSSPSWTNGDSLFLFVVLAVSLSTSWALQKAFDSVAAAGTQNIGTIVFKQKIAERKASSQSVWGRVDNKAPVFNLDTVRTGEGASAVVTLHDGTEIHLDENTMVGLELKEKKFSVALVTGKVGAKRLTAAPQNFSITAKGVGVTMEGGAVTVSSGAEGVALQTDTAVEVQSGGTTSTVQASQTALVTEGKAPVVQKPLATLLQPADQTYAVGSANVQTVAFTWKSETPGSALQIALDGKFPGRQISGDGEAKIALPAGSYTWRVVNAGTVSETRRLVVYQGAAPQPIEPRGVKEVADPQNNLVPFAWSKTSDADSYRLDILGIDGAVIRTATTTLTALSVSLPPGSYRWRVAGTYPFAQAEIVSQTASFEIRRLEKLPPPTVASSATEVRQFSALSQNSVLGWESVSDADHYEVVIARDPDFKDVVSTTQTTANVLGRPAGLVPGNYYWRVRALTETLTSDVSATHEFAVAASLPLQGLTPRSVTESPLAVAWNDPNHGRRYRVEVSQALDFSEIASALDVTAAGGGDRRAAELAWNRPGSFFWRVSLVGEGGSVLASSAPLEFTVPGGLKPPSLLSPTADLDINGISTLMFRWNAVPGAELYHLTLSLSLAGRTQEVFEGETAATSMTFDKWNLLTLGPYSWKLVAQSGAQRSREAQASFSLTQARQLKAVSLRVPKVIYLPEAP